MKTPVGNSTDCADSDKPLDLLDIRRDIDAIDLQIQHLLNQRAEAACRVAVAKQAEAGGKPVDFYRPEREAQILKSVAQRNEGPMSDSAVQCIFREIISASLALEEPIRVAYLGPEGTYTHSAAEKHFGQAAQTIPESSIADIFKVVESGRVRFGVIPVENSTEGTVNQTLDMLPHTSLRVCGELSLRIQHNVLSRSDSLADITTVHAHPQALAQCWHWLNENLPSAQRISESSNAQAAKVALEQPTAAAIASETAGKLYGLNNLMHGIEDEKNNTTRFLVIGDQDIPPSGDDSTLIMFAAPHKPGGLRKVLQPLEEAGVSMTRIESRPSRNALWEYHFFIDVDGHQYDETLAPVLDVLRELTPFLKVLGSYPRAL